ncbi:hypothetical protein THMIRHAM_01010 [Thiomicrorhabdus immobilis]|uniref:Protein BatD n=1 Tax=Thiomicrorhabdus immobilis TaxID=2791037 RepID=A0ABM7MAG6_9GAMM|nr:hypothetical protein [Thiomicrorhabdus immobilis]BCN92316.1 hypothetical protein THMIRHAM_01010 [Thiomicrorhabdus immobilis]
MVNTMRTLGCRLLALFLVTFFVSPAMAFDAEVTRPGDLAKAEATQESSPITVRIRPTNVQLGEPVSLVIEGEKIGQSTALLDWSNLKQDFVINGVDQHSYLLRLTLYPLKEGDLVIAEQNAGRVHIPRTVIQVQANPQVSIQWQKPKAELFSTQQGVWQAKVAVDNPAFLVEMQPSSESENNEIITHLLSSLSHPQLHMVSYEMPSVSKRQTVLINSPVVEVKNTSNRRWKFFDSPQTVQIKPLPIFLPMSAAVGEIDWKITPLRRFYQVGDLYYWHWQLTGQGVTEDYLKSTAYQLIGQLTHNDQLAWLAESMQATQMSDDKGMLTQLDVQIPFRIKQPGLVDFPELVLRSFNPDQAKVSQQTFAVASVVVVPGWLVWIFNWLILLLGIVSGYFILLLVKQYWLNIQLRRQLKEAQTSEHVLQAILSWQSKHLLGLSMTGQTNQIQSLRQFEQWYQQLYGDSPILSTLIDELNAMLYSKSSQEASFSSIRNNAQAWAYSLSIIKGSQLAFKRVLRKVMQALRLNR